MSHSLFVAFYGGPAYAFWPSESLSARSIFSGNTRWRTYTFPHLYKKAVLVFVLWLSIVLDMFGADSWVCPELCLVGFFSICIKSVHLCPVQEGNACSHLVVVKRDRWRYWIYDLVCQNIIGIFWCFLDFPQARGQDKKRLHWPYMLWCDFPIALGRCRCGHASSRFPIAKLSWSLFALWLASWYTEHLTGIFGNSRSPPGSPNLCWTGRVKSQYWRKGDRILKIDWLSWL